jgi:calcineurin-like phosphoesterase family protein
VSKTWWTSDTHLGHENIIRHCDRPFADADEMDATIMAQWNATVRPADTIWHLGDFCFRSGKPAAWYLKRLQGKKHLVVGNHDNEDTQSAGWESVSQMQEIAVDGARICLLHYAMRVWPRSHHGSLHFFGHSHGRLAGDRQACDVGCDSWGFRPIGLEEIRAHLETLPERSADR